NGMSPDTAKYSISATEVADINAQAAHIKDKDCDQSEPPVISRGNEKECGMVIAWFTARGHEQISATYVISNEKNIIEVWQEQDVTVEGNNGGALQASAQVLQAGKAPPQRAGLLAGVKDDAPVTTAVDKPASFRVAIAREFPEDWLFQQANEEPVSIATLVLDADLTKHALKTKGAAAYESEVTAILIVSAAHAKDLFSFALPTGDFLNRQGPTLVPAWQRPREDEDSHAYCKRVAGG
ncbi:unnamed protein product, partial [Prorocentrum cordatum]